MLHSQNYIPNKNMTKFQVLHQQKDLVLTLDDLMILMYLLVRNTGKDLQKATNSTASVPQFIPTTFSSTSVTPQ